MKGKKMKKLKVCMSVISMLLLLPLITSPTFAQEMELDPNYHSQNPGQFYEPGDEIKTFDESKSSVMEGIAGSGIHKSDFGEVGERRHASFLGEEVELYPEFIDQGKALQNVKDLLNEYLQTLKIEYDLEEFSDETWLDYREASYSYNSEHYSEQDYSDKNFWVLDFFCDIYENVDANQKILDQIDTLTSIRSFSVDEEVKKNFALSLPYNSTYYKNHDPSTSEFALREKESMSRASQGLTNALNYAERYAVTPNNAYRLYPADCTNFVSQIVLAGGQPLTSTWALYTPTWAAADAFGKYFGIWASTDSIYTFSCFRARGDVIGLDDNNDGNLDHMGFVTGAQAGFVSTHGYNYNDFKVAQHSGNYNSWVSAEENHWETSGAGADGWYFVELNRIVPL